MSDACVHTHTGGPDYLSTLTASSSKNCIFCIGHLNWNNDMTVLRLKKKEIKKRNKNVTNRVPVLVSPSRGRSGQEPPWCVVHDAEGFFILFTIEGEDDTKPMYICGLFFSIFDDTYKW